MDYHDNNHNDLVVWQFLAFALLLIGLRVAGIYGIYFFEEDELSLAAGIAALVNDNIGDLYRYTPQLGYYRLMEALTALAGGQVAQVPLIMKAASAFMGVVVPLSALFFFRTELTAKVRWLAALVLACNPILWKSSQYGNSAMLALGLACVALALLSNRPRAGGTVLALGLLAAAVLVRADTVVLLPVAGLLLWYQHRSFVRAAARLALLGLGLGGVYLLLFAFDPRLDNAVDAVAAHFSVARPTLFWEYLLWAISPLPFIFAMLGIGRLHEQSPVVLLMLLAWLLPPLALYFTATTTPRYFLLTVVPFALLAAVGIHQAAAMLARWITRTPAYAVILALAFVHVLVGVGHFKSSWRASPLYGPTFRTDDGNMPTGALLYDTYFRHGFLGQSFAHPGFARGTEPHWEGPFFDKALQILEAGNHGSATTVVLLDTGYGHAFHYHAQVAAATYVSRQPSDPSIPFSSVTWLELGDARVMTVAIWSAYYRQLAQLPLAAGDRLWVMGDAAFPDAAALDKMPNGLRLVPAESFDERMRVFLVEEQQT